jgi:hypothetical protein
MEMACTRDAMDIIAASNIFYKGKDGEAAFIEDYSATRDERGNEILNINGRFLSSLLDRRVINLSVTGNLTSLVNAVLAQNFIGASNVNRNIPEFRAVNLTTVNNPVIAVDYKNVTALEAIQKICQPNNIGFYVMFNIANASYDFHLYEGRQTNVIFSDNFFNILEQDYYYKTADAKTTCYVNIQDAITVVGDTITGLDRKEMYLSGNANNTQSVTQQGQQALNDKAVIESFDTVINSGTLQFAYKTDWDLGDIVTSESIKWGKTIIQNLLEITEYYDKGGVHLTPIFGSYLEK